MRILMCQPGPHFSVFDVYRGWYEAFQDLGVTVADYNLGDRLTFYDSAMVEISEYPGDGATTISIDIGDRVLNLKKALSQEKAHELAVNGIYAALYKLKPDVLFLVSAFFIPPDLIDLARANGTKVVMLATESPYEDGRQLTYADHVDMMLLNDPINLEKFREKTPTYYVPHAYRPSVHHLGSGDASPEYAADFAFVGTGFRSRIEFMEKMDFGDLDVLLAGNWGELTEDSPLWKHVAHEVGECLDNEQTAQVYQSSKVGMNLYRREAETPEHSQGVALGPREVEMAACGMFFLRDPRPEGDEVLHMLPRFTSPEEASDQLEWWINHPVQRRDTALKARAAIRDRTFENNAKDFLRRLEEV